MENYALLLNNDTTSWQDWFELITCIAVAGGTYDIASQVSELSSKHDITVFNKLWNTVSTFNKYHVLLRKCYESMLMC